VTISAQVFIFPLLLYYFGVFYPVSLIVNLICVPLVSFIAFSTLTGIIFSFIPFAGKAYLLIAEWLTDLLFHIIKIFALTAPASLKWKMPLYGVLVYYLFCLSVWLYLRKPGKNQLKFIQ
jgi:competence protein ComEC